MDVSTLFPHERVRPIQQHLIQFVTNAIEKKQHALIHAPTGLGKTAASITPALAKALERDLIIVFLTSRHTQHAIVMETLQKIKQKTNKQISVVSLIGKKQ